MITFLAGLFTQDYCIELILSELVIELLIISFATVVMLK